MSATPVTSRQSSPVRDTREVFAQTATELLDENPTTALVYAVIGGQFFGAAKHRHPERVIDVGIREQLLVDVGAGMALAGMRPIVHTFASFLVERAFEQIKLGFSHQDVGGVLVSTGASYDMAGAGRTHQSPADVTLLDTLPDWTIHVPGHADEVEHALREAVNGTGRHYVRVQAQQNAQPLHGCGLHRLTTGRGAVVIAVGPMLDPVLAATDDLDVTVLYTNTVRPFDAAGLLDAVSATGPTDVVLVEPYLRGTFAGVVSDALHNVPHRLLSLGVGRDELRRYGTPKQHAAAHGLDAVGIRRSISGWPSQ